MYTTVIVPFEYYASHSLSLRANPHDRHSTLKLFVRGIRKDGMGIDILTLRPLTDPYPEKLADIHLNENSVLVKEQAARPTSEMLAAYFYMRVSETIEKSDANAELKVVEVKLHKEVLSNVQHEEKEQDSNCPL